MAAVTHSDFSDVTAGITALLLFYHECIISVKGKRGKKSRKKEEKKNGCHLSPDEGVEHS